MSERVGDGHVGEIRLVAAAERPAAGREHDPVELATTGRRG